MRCVHFFAFSPDCFFLHSRAAVDEAHYRLPGQPGSSECSGCVAPDTQPGGRSTIHLNLPRAVQFLNKTNELNLQTRRMPEEGSLQPGHTNQVAKSRRFA